MKTAFVGLLLLMSGAALQTSVNAADAGAFVRDFCAAYKARNAARMAQFYATDATSIDPSFEPDLKVPRS